MEISQDLGQSILNRLTDIIPYEMNFISQDAVIIASTDPNRINGFHQGAQIVLETSEALLIDKPEDYLNTKEGINLPIVIDHQIVGIIGITGKASQVEPFGKIIQRMTELLIQEERIRSLSFTQRTNYNHLFDYLSVLDLNSDAISSLSDILSVDLSVSRYFAVGSYYSDNHTTQMQEYVSNHLSSYFASDKETIYSVTGQSIRILSPSQDIHKLLEQLSRYLFESESIQVYFGIGTSANSIESIRKSYQEATMALDWNIQTSKSPTLNYEDLDLGLLFSNFDQDFISLYIDKILNQLNEDEVNEYQQLFQVYEQTNGSISQCADHLFIHKNTVQYKLGKFKRLTGLDFRNLHDYLLIALAFKLLDRAK